MMRSIAAMLAAIVLLPQVNAQAQPYPSKPIRFVIPFGAGSATDALARIAGQELERTLGQPIIVVPKPGADGALSASEVKEPPYDVVTDFTPVTYLGDNSFFIVVHPSVPATSLPQLIAVAKSSATPLTYATGNTYAFVTISMLAKSNGLKLEAVRYKSEPDAITDMLAGRVQVMNGTATSLLAHIKAGKLRALSTSFEGRSPLLPELPSLIEAGQPKFPIAAWVALVGPPGLPPEIVATMNKAMAAALAKPSVREQMESQGFIPRSSTPGELATYMKDQLGVWKVVLKDAGIEPQ